MTEDQKQKQNKVRFQSPDLKEDGRPKYDESS